MGPDEGRGGAAAGPARGTGRAHAVESVRHGVRPAPGEA